MQGGATFQFATDGIESAREQLLVCTDPTASIAFASVASYVHSSASAARAATAMSAFVLA
jgi:hypothetical protein